MDRIRRFPLSDLHLATDNWADENKIGEGGFAIIYRGTLPESGEVVAIKRCKVGSGWRFKVWLYGYMHEKQGGLSFMF